MLSGVLLFLGGDFCFYWPLALLGFKADWVIAMVAFHLVLQLLPHTRVVPKLPAFIESWMNTPSHHRVHHARNDLYLDKNYGVTSPPNTWDPTFINFQVWKQLVIDAWNAPSWFDKVRVWFMPTGWRPVGVAALPNAGWQRDGREVKFQSTPFKGSKPYLVLQVALGFPLMLLVTRPDTTLMMFDRVLFSIALWAAATAWGGILESKRWAIWLELGRLTAQSLLLLSFTSRGFIPLSWAIAGGVLGALSCAWALTLRSSNEPLSLPVTSS